MKELTKAEEQIMQVLWKLEKAFVNDLIEKLENPKPAYNTVSTIIRILEKKGFVEHKAYGKAHQYFPLISKEEYRKQFFHGFLGRYFSGSFKQLVSSFSEEDNLTLQELEDIQQLMEEEINKKKLNK